MLRTKTCGELTAADIGQTATLCGWVSKVRNLGALIFVDLRDRAGVTQIALSPEQYEKTPLKSEYCLQVTGQVVGRSEPNPKLSTGAIEVKAAEIRLFSRSQLPPFIVADKTDALEETRLKNRYLDLRRPCLQANLQRRAQLVKSLREYLEERGFLEVETPTLIKSTPEGARDYLVPSRTRPGSFYALPQSPQIFKQLLMVGGIDRYYQVARCYRDEDLRADRQPEFTQLDVEMSFVEREDVLEVIEGMLKKAFRDILGVELQDFARLSYRECIERYGSDKPDLRYDLPLRDLDGIFAATEFELLRGVHVKGIRLPGFASGCTRKIADQDNVDLKNFGLHSAFHLKMADGALSGGLVKNLQPLEIERLIAEFGLADGDLLIVGFGADYEVLSTAFGALRRTYAARLGLVDENCYRPLFVLDWPIFGREEGRIVSLSNPFTRPRDEDLHYLESDPTKALSYAYDTVVNGIELSSGSLRIYDSAVQERIFELLGLSAADIEAKFGFFVEALRYGTPPHGGFAIGLERLAMILCKTDNIHDVVAFPKNLQAVCPMSQAPSPVPAEALKVLKICTEGPDRE